MYRHVISKSGTCAGAHSRVVLLWFTLLVLTIAQGTALASPEDALRAATQEIYDTLLAQRSELEADPSKVQPLINNTIAPLIDFEIMGRMVLGKYWRSATEDQRSRFTVEFRRFLVRFYSEAVKEYIVEEGIPDNLTMEILPSQQSSSGQTAKVKTRVYQPGNPPLDVGYTLFEKDGKWRVVDLQVENISLVINYRQSFTNQIRSVGLDGLIANLAERNGTSEG